jgi:serine protease
MATVSWVAPATGGGSIPGYDVTASPGAKTVSTSGALTADVGGLLNGAAYTFTVVARNAVSVSCSKRSASMAPPQV